MQIAHLGHCPHLHIADIATAAAVVAAYLTILFFATRRKTVKATRRATLREYLDILRKK